MLLYQREELLADVGGHALTKRRVEPNYLPFIFLPAGGGAAWFGVGQLVGIAAVCQSFLVHRGGSHEFLLR